MEAAPMGIALPAPRRAAEAAGLCHGAGQGQRIRGWRGI